MLSEIVGHGESVIFQGQMSVNPVQYVNLTTGGLCHLLIKMDSNVPHNSRFLLGFYSLLDIWSIDNNSVLYQC